METVVLVIHLILALSIILLILLQRSEGGGLGIGGGSGGLGGFATAGQTANVLTRATAICAACFLPPVCCSRFWPGPRKNLPTFLNLWITCRPLLTLRPRQAIKKTRKLKAPEKSPSHLQCPFQSNVPARHLPAGAGDFIGF